MDERDAIAAEEILRFALFKEVYRAKKKTKTKKRRLNGVARSGSRADGSETEGDESEEDEEDETDEEEEAALAGGERRMPMPGSASKPGRRGTSARASSVATSMATGTGAGTANDDSGIGMNTTLRSTQAGTSPAKPTQASSTRDGDADMDEETQEEERAAAGPAPAAMSGPVDPAR